MTQRDLIDSPPDLPSALKADTLLSSVGITEACWMFYSIPILFVDCCALRQLDKVHSSAVKLKLVGWTDSKPRGRHRDAVRVKNGADLMNTRAASEPLFNAVAGGQGVISWVFFYYYYFWGGSCLLLMLRVCASLSS